MKIFKTLSKRGLALFLALMMCVSLLPANALAMELAETTHTCNEDGWTCVKTDVLTCKEEHEHTDVCYEWTHTQPSAEVSIFLRAVKELPAKVTAEDADLIAKVRSAYDALNLDEQTNPSVVEALKDLVKAEETLKAIAAARAAEAEEAAKLEEVVKAFTDAVDALPEEITAEDEAAVTEARNAYEAYELLDETAQAKESVAEALTKLEAAEAVLAKLKAEAEEEAVEKAKAEADAQAAVKPFVDAVAALPEAGEIPDDISTERLEQIGEDARACSELYDELDVAYMDRDEVVAAMEKLIEVYARVAEVADLQSRTLEKEITLNVGESTTLKGTSGYVFHDWKVIEGGAYVSITSSTKESSVTVKGESAGIATIKHTYGYGKFSDSEQFTIQVLGGTVITYRASYGGTVSPASETVEEGQDAQGSTATPYDNYIFRNWTNSNGNVVSTSPAFVPDSTATATYTANFVDAGSQTAYFYILKPGSNWETAGDKDNYTDAWYYVGTGTVKGTAANASNAYAQIQSEPGSYPPITVTEDGETHKYTYAATSGGDYTYTVEWVRVVSSSGANNEGSIITNDTCWHVDGIANLHTPTRATVTFKFQDYNQGSFALDKVGNADAAYRVKVGQKIPANKVPSHDATKTVNGVTYTFEGWYTDEACTGNKITDPSNYSITGDVTFYGKYTARYTVRYDLAGGVSSDSKPLTYSSLKSGTATPKIADPTREGYSFTGWSPKVADTVSGNATYVAKWERDSYTVTYTVDGEQVGEVETYEYGADVTIRDKFVKEGYTVSDWSRTEDFTMPANNVVITATSAVNSYTVTYAGLEGATVSNNPTTYTVETETFALNNPRRPGYIFAGWTGTGLDGETVTVTVTKGSTGNRSYTANWEADILIDPTIPANERPNNGGDGIPDKYQITVNFAAVNGTVSFGSAVVTKRDANGNPSENGTARLAQQHIPTAEAREGYWDGTWDKAPEVGRVVMDGETLTITYTAVPTEPVFPPPADPDPTPIPDTPTPLDPGTDIPDEEVPLANAVGLNDVDHFAYVIGYDDDTVRPLNNITRAEAVTIFFRLMTDEYRAANWSTENTFSDVNAGNWFNNAVSTVQKAGALEHFAQDEKFLPNQAITRAEFASIAAGFVSDEITGENVGDFSDTEGHWAAEAIRKAVEAGWINGVGGNRFAPDQTITRAEVMAMINRMLDRIPDADHMLPDMKKWTDNPEDAWYYADVQEATNEHDYERDEMSVETWTLIKEHRDWAALETKWAANGGTTAPVEPAQPAEGETEGTEGTEQ